MVELDGRHERARQTLLKLATVPGIKTLDECDFAFAISPKAPVLELAGQKACFSPATSSRAVSSAPMWTSRSPRCPCSDSS